MGFDPGCPTPEPGLNPCRDLTVVFDEVSTRKERNKYGVLAGSRTSTAGSPAELIRDTETPDGPFQNGCCRQNARSPHFALWH